MMIPTIMTERVILRAPIMDDFAPYAETLMDPERSKYIDGPYTRDGVWKDMCSMIANWHLQGFGGWSLERRRTGEFLGMIAISQPPSFPEVELGWVIQESAEGHGYAFEAAQAMHKYAFSELGLDTAVSYIDPANARSIALAERLGATRDENAARPENDPCLVYRHHKPEATS